jgi:hypothetical protein
MNTIELGGTPASIEPYLNPAYWNERFMGDGTAQSWPGHGEPGIKDWAWCATALTSYASQGASRLALSRLHSGDVFDASDHDSGTILLTLAEDLARAPEAEDVVPMTEFQGVPTPDRLSGIGDGEQAREGHGYEYKARPLLNLVVGRKERRVLTIPDAVVGDRPDFNNKGYARVISDNTERGFTKFTVGEVYNFGYNDDPSDQVLARVTEAIICINGVRGRRGTSPLKALLAKSLGGSFSPATDPV